MRHGLGLGEGGGVVLGQSEFADKALPHCAWQLGQLGANPLDPGAVDHQRRQVRVGKVAVVRGVFLAAHGSRLAGIRVEQHRGLLDRVAVFDLCNLPADLVVDRLLHELEAVEVLDLAAGPEFGARPAHRHVGVATETALLHVAVANADPGDESVQFLGVGHRLGRGAHVGLGDDLQQRRSGSVEVDAGLAHKALVQRLASVFFEVGTHQPHRSRHGVEHEGHMAALHHRQFKLADLVALGKVRIEIILARENAVRGNIRADRQPEADGALDGAAVHHRQCAGQRQVDRAGLGIGRGSERGTGAAENLGAGRELRMGLEADHHLIALDQQRLGGWIGRSVRVAHIRTPAVCGHESR